MTMPVVTSVSVDPRDGEDEAAKGEGAAPKGEEPSPDAKGEGCAASGDGAAGSGASDPGSGEGAVEAGADTLGLGLPESSAAAGDGVSRDPARHVASTSNVGEARCMVQR
jgi:hypothetical protein